MKTSILVQHPILVLLAAFIGGMILEWLLELFFFRARLFQLEADLRLREKDLEDAKFRLGKVSVELRSKHDLITALQRSKAAAESAVQMLQPRLSSAESALETRDRELAALETQSTSLEQRTEEMTREILELQLNERVLSANLLTAEQASCELRRTLEAVQLDEQARIERLGELQSLVASNASVLLALESAVTNRDESILRLKDEIKGSAARLSEADSALGKAETGTNQLRAQMASAKSEISNLSREREAAKVRAAELEKRLGEMERKGTELQNDLERATRELTGSAAVKDQLAKSRKEGEEAIREWELLKEKVTRLEARPPVSSQSPNVEAVLADLESITRERNDLAAELATIRAISPVASAKGPQPRETGRRSRKKSSMAGESVTRCPQHLATVRGLGPIFQGMLYTAGIGTFWQLANLSNTELGEILEAGDGDGPLDLDSIRAEALRLAEESDSVGYRWSGQKPDDFAPLSGIGSEFERRLYDAGICTYESLAEASIERLEEICPGTPSRKPDYANWVTQARARIEAGQV